MGEKIVIAVPSKGRPFGHTFNLVKNVSVPVFVYIHEPEYYAYKESLPGHFNIVTHNFNDIGNIRRFIQKQHHDAGETLFMLDDDILCLFEEKGEYRAGIESIIEVVRNNPSYGVLCPICITHMAPTFPMPPTFSDYCLAVFYVLRPFVYDRGVIFTDESGLTEDHDFSAQVNLKKIKACRLPFYLFFKMMGSSSHFNTLWHIISSVKLYNKYGVLYDILPDLRGDSPVPIYVSFNEPAIEDTLKEIRYSHLTNRFLESFIKLCEESKDLRYKDIKECIPQIKQVLENVKNKPLATDFIFSRSSFLELRKYPDLCGEDYIEAVNLFRKRCESPVIPRAHFYPIVH